MRIVVEGSGMWGMEYFQALKSQVDSEKVGVFFTYDSTFGLDAYAEHLPAPLFADYLAMTLDHVKTIEETGFACIDVKDTLFKRNDRTNLRRHQLPEQVDAVFVATPDRTHCDVAEYWLGHAKWVFVEKPFDVSVDRIGQFLHKYRQLYFSCD